LEGAISAALKVEQKADKFIKAQKVLETFDKSHHRSLHDTAKNKIGLFMG
jgi:hypothetical protein